MKILKHLFDNNRNWAEKRKESDPDFFNKLVHQQTPQYLWIGCSDSRVPANEIVGLLPGELFVHRNIANLVPENDLNCLSVIQFAVESLKVKHIIVCGHYGCGGVKTVLDNTKLGLADEWLINMMKIKEEFSAKLYKINDELIRFNKLCELNVIEQVFNVCNSDTIVNAWKRNQSITIHGWIYDIKDGLLQDLDVCISNPDEFKIAKTEAISKIF